MKTFTLLSIALTFIFADVTAQTGPENLIISISGGAIQQRPLAVRMEFSATGNNIFDANDTTLFPAPDTINLVNSILSPATMLPDTSTAIEVHSSVIGDFDTITSVATTTWNTEIRPFTISGNGVAINAVDSRPEINRYSVFDFGIASDHADTVIINAASFIDIVSTNYSVNKNISFVYLEELSTGMFYSILNQSVQLIIPVDTTYEVNYKLHVMVKADISTVAATCLDPSSGSILIENSASNPWNYTVYQNGTSIVTSACLAADTSATVQPGAYAVTVYVNNLLADSIQVTVNSPVPVVADFTADNYYVDVNNTVSFTNFSSGSITYSWNFGDSTSDTLENTTHSYATAGTYPVTLTAINQYGCQAAFTDSIFVSDVLSAHQSSSFSSSFYENESRNSSAATMRTGNLPDVNVGSEAQKISVKQNGITEQLQVQIMNLNGELISSAFVTDQSNTFNVPVSGIYLVIIQGQNGQVITKKIMVTN
ncbi:hypothetical protein BH11BAC7_BH11BAC7_10630 [soil metagenome]